MKSRTFKGVSSVIPTGITTVENSNSLQGIVGKQVTVKAQVTVADGQSKAGIPVTFNVPGNTSTLSPAVTAEVTTDANGVASYSYTRYQATTDDVVAYATGDRSKFATSKVYWGVSSQLTITEVNEGTAVKNGSNKTYKVKLVNTNGHALAGKQVQVSFLENINAEVNKLSTATINGVNPSQLNNGSAIKTAAVTTDSNGEAVFTVTGTNTTATPVVFVPTETTPANNTYSSGLLQAVAAKVTFSAQQTDYTLKIVGSGTKDAATDYKNAREFTITVTGKDGKPAANELVKFGLNENMDNNMSTNTKSKFVTFDAAGNPTVVADNVVHSVKTNAKGEATFYVGTALGNVNDYATPFAWIDINTSNASASNVFESGEPSTTGEMTFFTQERLVSSKLVTKNDKGTLTENFESGSFAKFEFQLSNQSGKKISFSNAGIATVTAQFNVYNNGANDVLAFDNITDANNYLSAPTNDAYKAKGTLISPNRSEKVDVNTAIEANANIYVVPVNKTKSTSVSVTSSAVATKVGGGTVALVIGEAKEAKFTATNEVSALHTGVVGSFDTDDETITFDGKNPVAYAGEAGKTYVFKGLNGAPISTAKLFLAELSGAAGSVTATYEVKENVVTFYINSVKSTGTAPVDTVAVAEAAALATAISTANTELGKVTAAQTAYTTAGGLATATVYTDVTTAKDELQALVTAGKDTAGIKAATTKLTTKLTALKDATDALSASQTLSKLTAAKAKIETAATFTGKLTAATAATDADAKTLITSTVNALPEVTGKGFTVTVTTSGFSAATAGTKDGSVNASIVLTAADGQKVTATVTGIVITQ